MATSSVFDDLLNSAPAGKPPAGGSSAFDDLLEQAPTASGQQIIPGMEKLGGAPPAAPKPPTPAGLLTPEQQAAEGPILRSRTGQLYQSTPQGSFPVLDAPATGITNIRQGIEQIAEPGVAEKAAGGSKIIQGLGQVAEPLAAGGALTAPVATAATVASSMVADAATRKALQASGVSPEVSQFAGDVAGLLAGAGGAAYLVRRAYIAAGQPEVRFGKFEEPKPFRDMTDEELVAHANAIEKNRPKNYDWQREQIAQEALRRQAGRGMGPGATGAAAAEAPPPEQPAPEATATAPAPAPETAASPEGVLASAPPAIEKGTSVTTSDGTYTVRKISGDKAITTFIPTGGKPTPRVLPVADLQAMMPPAAQPEATTAATPPPEAVPTAAAPPTPAEPDTYRNAVALVRSLGKASTSSLQRYFRIGYGAAGQMLDRMEADGIIGPANGTGPREVLGATSAAAVQPESPSPSPATIEPTSPDELLAAAPPAPQPTSAPSVPSAPLAAAAQERIAGPIATPVPAQEPPVSLSAPEAEESLPALSEPNYRRIVWKGGPGNYWIRPDSPDKEESGPYPSARAAATALQEELHEGVKAGPVIEATATHENSSTQTNLPETVATAVTDFASAIPKDQISEKGTEPEPHITVKYRAGDDLEAVRKALENEPPVTVTLGNASVFPAKEGDPEAADVLKVDVDSPDLHRLNGKVAEVFSHPDDYPTYQPHVTIAYLKPGEGAQYDGKPIPGVTGQELTLPTVTFSGKDGEKTEIPLEGEVVPETPAEKAARERLQKFEDLGRAIGAGEISAHDAMELVRKKFGKEWDELKQKNAKGWEDLREKLGLPASPAGAVDITGWAVERPAIAAPQENASSPAPSGASQTPSMPGAVASSDLQAEADRLRAENEKLRAARAAKAVPAEKGLSTHLRQQAESLQNQIEQKRNPAIANQNPTARRAGIAGNMAAVADNLEQIQITMRALADAHDAGTIPETLRGLRSRPAIEDLLYREHFPNPFVHQASINDLQKVRGKPGTKAGMDLLTRRNTSSDGGARLYGMDEIKAVSDLVDKAEAAGVTTAKYVRDDLQRAKRLYLAGLGPNNWEKARNDLKALGKAKPAEPTKERQIREAERDLLGTKIEGYFPTPKPLAQRLVEAADIKPGMSVLEPSAGNGAIADEIRAVGVKPSVIEPIDRLRKILELKGHEFAEDGNRDFLEHQGDYDRIVMNPPFERGQDMDHVRHAYGLLKPGGRLVAIMGEGSFFRKELKATEFRNWLEKNGGFSEKLPEGSFTGKDAQRQTGVATRMVVIDKPTAKPEITVHPDYVRKEQESRAARAEFHRQQEAEEAAGVAPATKAPWEMRRDDYARENWQDEIQRFRDRPDILDTKNRDEEIAHFKQLHVDAVAKALRAGKSVPVEVLADYPALQKKAAPPEEFHKPEMGAPPPLAAYGAAKPTEPAKPQFVEKIPTENPDIEGGSYTINRWPGGQYQVWHRSNGLGSSFGSNFPTLEAARDIVKTWDENYRERVKVDQQIQENRAAERQKELVPAFADWKTGRAYVDGKGNYHLRAVGQKTGSGPIAPWNKQVKAAFKDVTEFHRAANEYQIAELQKQLEAKKAEPAKAEAPSAERFDQIYRELQSLNKRTDIAPEQAHNRRVDLEGELETHRPAAEARATEEMQRDKAAKEAASPGLVRAHLESLEKRLRAQSPESEAYGKLLDEVEEYRSSTNLQTPSNYEFANGFIQNGYVRRNEAIAKRKLPNGIQVNGKVDFQILKQNYTGTLLGVDDNGTASVKQANGKVAKLPANQLFPEGKKQPPPIQEKAATVDFGKEHSENGRKQFTARGVKEDGSPSGEFVTVKQDRADSSLWNVERQFYLLPPGEANRYGHQETQTVASRYPKAEAKQIAESFLKGEPSPFAKFETGLPMSEYKKGKPANFGESSTATGAGGLVHSKVDGVEAWSNGHVAFKSAPPGELSKHERQPDIQKSFDEAKRSAKHEAAPVGFYRQANTTHIVLAGKKGKPVAINGQYFDYAKKAYPDATFKAENEKNAVAVYSGKDLVGVIMPMRAGEEGFPAGIQNLLKSSKPEAGTAAEEQGAEREASRTSRLEDRDIPQEESRLPRLAPKDTGFLRDAPTGVHAGLMRFEPVDLSAADSGRNAAYVTNPSGIEFLGRLLGKPKDDSGLNIGGTIFRPARAGLIAELAGQALARGDKPAARIGQIRDIAARAHAEGKSLILVVDDRGTPDEKMEMVLREELDHAAQSVMTGAASTHLGDRTEPFMSTPLAQRTQAHLEEQHGYSFESPGKAAAEIGVRLMRPGGSRELGLSQREARQLALNYMRALRSEYGREKSREIRGRVAAADRAGRGGSAIESGHLPGRLGPEGSGGIEGGPGSTPPAATGREGRPELRPRQPGEPDDESRLPRQGLEGHGAPPALERGGRPGNPENEPAEVSPDNLLSSESGSSPVEPIQVALSNFTQALRAQFGEEYPKANYSGLGAAKDRYVRNLSQTVEASPSVYQAALLAATAKSQTGVLIATAHPRMAGELAKSHLTLPEFYTWLIEDRLHGADGTSGLEGRWRDFASQAQTQTQEELEQGMTDEHFLGLLSKIEGKKDLPQNLGETAIAIMQSGDWPLLRDYLELSFHDAADAVTHMLPAGEYTRFANDPNVQEALRIYKDRIEKAVADDHALNEGVFSNALGDTHTYVPLIPLAEEGAEVRHGTGQAYPYKKPRNIANQFATGLSPAYSAEPKDLRERFQAGIRANTKAALNRAAEEAGLYQNPRKLEDPGVVTWRGVDYAASRPYVVSEARTIIQNGKVAHVPPKTVVMPEWFHREMAPILEGERWDANDLQPIINMIMKFTLSGLAEPAFHWANITGAIVANTPFLANTVPGKIASLPLLKRFASIGYALSVDPTTDESARDMMEMAKVGAIPSRYGTETYSRQAAEMMGAHKRMFSLAPALFGPKGMDIRYRLFMWRLAKAIEPHATPKELNLFVNQLGNYIPQLQGELERRFKGSGFSPFYTAGSTMLRNGLNAWTGRSPVPGNKTASLLAWKLATGAAGMLALWVAAHKALAGDYPWEDNRSKFLSIPVGGNRGVFNKDLRYSGLGKKMWGPGPETGYIGLGFFNPLALRGARAIGLPGAYNAMMRKGSAGQDFEAAQRDVMNSLIHPVAGPPLRAAFILGMGTEPQISDFRDRRGTVSPSLYRAIPQKSAPGLPTVGNKALALLSLNSFYNNLGEATGILEDPQRKGSMWWRTVTDMAMPGLFQTASNPFKQETYLREQRRGLQTTPRH